VHGDHETYLWQRGTNWKPELPSQEAGTFKTDLLRLVGEISPIDRNSLKNELCFALLCWVGGIAA
jgi:hypothetical protein